MHRVRVRPKRSRRKAANEGHDGVGDVRKLSTISCDICKQFEHNNNNNKLIREG